MATVRLGSIVADIRGSIGQQTYLRTPAGLIVRERVSPTQPASELRDQVQTNFTAVCQEWSGGLTAQQRLGWSTYGRLYPRPNAFGRPCLQTGYLAFCRSNMAAKTEDPTNWHRNPPDRPPLVIPEFSFLASDQTTHIQVNLSVADFVPLEVGFYLMVSAGLSCNSGVSYYNSPWRTVDQLRWGGSYFVPYDYNLVLPVWHGTGPKIFLKAYLYDSNTGAISTPAQHSAEVTPPT